MITICPPRSLEEILAAPLTAAEEAIADAHIITERNAIKARWSEIEHRRHWRAIPPLAGLQPRRLGWRPPVVHDGDLLGID